MWLCEEQPSLAYNTVDNYLSALKMNLCDKFPSIKNSFWDENYHTGLRDGVLTKWLHVRIVLGCSLERH